MSISKSRMMAMIYIKLLYVHIKNLIQIQMSYGSLIIHRTPKKLKKSYFTFHTRVISLLCFLYNGTISINGRFNFLSAGGWVDG